MSDETNVPCLGATVTCPAGGGVVAGRDLTYGEALVRLRQGTVFDTTHGQWTPFGELTVTGYDPDAPVWWGSQMVSACNVFENKGK